jgi:hypothetical protein
MMRWSLVLALALPACERDDLYGSSRLSENIEKAYTDCDPREIEFLSVKHNLQLAFDECGSNQFAHIAWSPNGEQLYFQLSSGGHLLDAQKTTVETVPTEVPGERPVWVSNDRILLPLLPNPKATTGGTGWRLADYNRGARTLEVIPFPATEPSDLHPAGEGADLFFTAKDDAGVRRPFRLRRDEGKIERAFSFIDGPVVDLVVEVGPGLIGWADAAGGHLTRLADGTELAAFPGVTRVIPHPEGRYVALELPGKPIPLFDQRTWGELSPEARKREEARRQKFVEGLPEWMPRESVPPELHIYDVEKSRRYRLSAFYGDRFEWWRPMNYWASFLLWGIEGKQLHRNVAISDLAERLRMADRGETPTGIEVFAGVPAETAPATPVSAGTQIPTETPAKVEFTPTVAPQ